MAAPCCSTRSANCRWGCRPLLRVLQEQRVERLGGRREIELNVRIIAATNRDLQQEVAEGRFRADLMFRLDVLPLHISPLRERKEDVLPLARRFISKYAPQEAHDELLTEDACRALLQRLAGQRP